MDNPEVSIIAHSPPRPLVGAPRILPHCYYRAYLNIGKKSRSNTLSRVVFHSLWIMWT